jgi:hypothetical protein
MSISPREEIQGQQYLSPARRFGGISWPSTTLRVSQAAPSTIQHRSCRCQCSGRGISRIWVTEDSGGCPRTPPSNLDAPSSGCLEEKVEPCLSRLLASRKPAVLPLFRLSVGSCIAGRRGRLQSLRLLDRCWTHLGHCQGCFCAQGLSIEPSGPVVRTKRGL